MVRIIVGKNDFESWCHKNNRTDLLKEWDYQANEPLTPQTVSHGSNKPIIWNCSACGHKWPARLANRTKLINPRGCPECGKKQAGLSRRQTTISQNGSFYDWCIINGKTNLLDEWDDEKNFPQTAKSIPWGSAKDYAWWKCPLCGESYQSRLDHRRKGMGHKYCKSSSHHNSDAEVGVLFYFQTAFGQKNVIANYTDAQRGISELDVYVPSLQVAVEYDGEGYHRDVMKDIRKDKVCADAGIKLYRIREPGCPVFQSTSVCIVRKKTSFNSDYDQALKLVFCDLGVDVDVNSVRDQGEIISLRGKIIFENSLQAHFPKIAAEWDFVANHPLTPKMIPYGADRTVGWICGKCGNRYTSLVYQRTSRLRPSGCPACGIEKRRKSRSHSVKQYSLDGDLLAEYSSIAEAAKHTGILQGNISACCSKRYASSGGFIWRYHDDNSPVVPLTKETIKPRFDRVVCQYSLDGEYVSEFATLIDAENISGISAANIYRNATGSRKSAGGYMWKFKEESTLVLPYKTNAHNRRCVWQFTLNGEFVAEFESVLYAEKMTGVNEATIRDCCSGRCKTAGGYIWRDAEQDK